MKSMSHTLYSINKPMYGKEYVLQVFEAQKCHLNCSSLLKLFLYHPFYQS